MAGPDPFPERIAQYRILRSLGSGGMAKVFLAMDERLQRQVALKLLPRHETDTIATEARFLQEARSAARLDHPNVCAIYEVGEAAEGNFIAMQFIEGETLADRMARRRLDLKEALDIAIQLLEALGEAHAKGIVHRDIKPANLMLTARDQVKVLDFGLAKNTLPGRDPTQLGLTQSGMVVGTVPYMSPEQLKAEPVDGRSDLFSAGTLLYEMASGNRPFTAKSGVEVMSAILREIPPLLADEMDVPSRAMPPALARILRHALEKDPAHRYPTAAAFRDELVVLRQSVGISSYELTAAQPASGSSGMVESLRRSGKTLRHSRALGWLAAAALGLPLLVGGGLWTRRLLASRPAVDSLAVLPFFTQAGDTEAELLAEGLVDQVIRDLARLPDLKVIARTSVMRYRGADPDLKAVGRSLGVKAILVGRLVIRGNRQELSAELVDSTDLRQLWSDTYPCTVADLPDLQARLLRDLARRTTLNLPEPKGKAAKHRVNGEAFELYIRGKRALEKMTLEDIKRGFGFLDAALKIDPKFALAHAEKAQGFLHLSYQHLPSAEALPNMRAEAEKALELDAGSSEAHSALAYVLAVFSFDHDEAEKLYKKAIEFSPGSARAHENYGYFLSARGRHAEAANELNQAINLDPLSASVYCVRGLASIMSRDWGKAEKDAIHVLEIEPDNLYAVGMFARIDLGRGQWLNALRRIEAIKGPKFSTLTVLRGVALGRLGRRKEAIQVADSFLMPGPGTTQALSHYNAAMIYAALGEKSKVVALLEAAFKAKEEPILFMNVDPSFDETRKDPDFIKLAQRIARK